MSSHVAPAAPIRVTNLTKRFGSVAAVSDLTFSVRAGAVTGFLGPNGAGKTTTMRTLLGLVRATSGSALINGVTYRELKRPAQVVGATLEASSFHPGRTALAHLKVYAPQVGATTARCHEVLEMVGLSEAKNRRVGGYSMGMRQRLALAWAMLGDPSIVILDEPANGLDPAGIVWMRQLLRALAGQGRTVLVSSHQLAEVQETVDDVVIIADGRLVHASSLAGLEELADRSVAVRTPNVAALEKLAVDRGWALSMEGPGVVVHGVRGDAVGPAAFSAGIEIHQMTDRVADLEDVFLDLTKGKVGR